MNWSSLPGSYLDPRREPNSAPFAILASACHPLPKRTYDAQWFFVRAKPTSSVVEVVVYVGICDRLLSAQTIFSATSVTFRFVGQARAEPCDGGAAERYLRMDLGEPLGDRKITGSCAPFPCSLERGTPAESHWNNARTYGS